MPTAFFLVPMIGAGTRDDPYRGRYTRDPQVAQAGCLRLSRQDDGIAMIDAPQAYLNSVASQADVLTLATEANIDQALTAGQATTARTALEARQIPAHWVVAGMTRREVIRTLSHVFLLNQRLEGIFQRPFHSRIEAWIQSGGLIGVGGVTAAPTNRDELQQQSRILLGLTFSELPAGAQNFLLNVRDRQEWTNQDLGLTAQSTVREILRSMTSQGVGIRRRLSRHGLTLNSTWATFPNTFRDELVEVAQDFGFDPVALGLSGASTLRQIMLTFAAQFASQPVFIGGVQV